MFPFLIFVFSEKIEYCGNKQKIYYIESNEVINFRDVTQIDVNDNELNKLIKLNVSASSQPTKKFIKMLKNKWLSDNLIIIDLRDDPHWLLLEDFSIKSTCDYLNKDIEENNAISDFGDDYHIFFEKPKENEIITFDSEIKKFIYPADVETEYSFCKNIGVENISIPIKDNELPDEYLNKFIEILRMYPNDKFHIHFHCVKGISRPTLFITLMDIYYNSNSTLDEILERSKKFNNYDLMNLQGIESDLKLQRINKIREFYDKIKNKY